MRFKINESTISSGFANVMFGDNIVGSSTPSKDKINQDLLRDVSDAAKKADVEVTITTAVTGHKKGTRHETGNAIDIAIVNGKGFSSESDAKSKKIHGAIEDFVDALVSMGYKKNTEKGHEKAVLTFGFKGHDNHIHVSRKTKSDVENSSSKIDDDSDEITIDKMSKDLDISDSSQLIFSDISGQSKMKKKGTPLKNDKYFVLHHTAGRGSASDVVNILNNREKGALGIQWIIDRDGKLYKSLPTGSMGLHVVPNKGSAPKDLSNRTSQGVEIIAKNDGDVLPKQCVTALKLVKKLGYPISNIYGHGELQSNKMADEGQKCKKYIQQNYSTTLEKNVSVDLSQEKKDQENTQPSDGIPKTFQDVMSYPEDQRREKYREWISQNIKLFEHQGLKKRSNKLNEEINKMRKLF